MLSNLRSLLLAAIVLSNCITWTASRHHYSHNVAGHRSRHRRQGAGLFLSASYVIPGGEGVGWGEWGEISPCSRTCGGGVASQKRICLQMGPDDQPACTGGDTKYFSCQTQDCPDGEDFRAQQCAEYNDVSFRGIKYKWVPYTRAPNPCELNCMPHGERFYYRQKTTVVDGTRCNDESFDVCVNGICQPVGCDMMLGSSAKEDKCRQCRGNGANCHTLSGLLDTQDLVKGYNDILLLPEGATTIIISEIRASNNYLALRAKNGTYYLNGDYHIDFPRSIVIAGAIWYYERSQQGFPAPDKLRCSGPINEPLYLSLLLQDDNVGIEYEYSLPKSLAPRPTQQYNWVHEEFTPCNVSCGGGTQTRNVTCRSREELNVVDDSLCDEGLKPPTSQACSTQACSPQWAASPWGECSKKCGKGGIKSREVHCEKVIINGFPSIVADKECFDLLGPKPELYQECNVDALCPTWFVGSWKPCDKLCDEGKQRRQVVCYQKHENNKKTILDDEDCEDEKPESEQSCMLEPCDGVDWVLSDWEGCDNCLSVNRTRIAECATKDHEVVDDKFCAYHPQPVLSEPCNAEKLPPCEVQWYATQWSKCSVDCGEGVQTRKVFCGRFDGESVMKVEDELCKDQPKYNTTKPCTVPKEKCPSKWYAGPWSECTKHCGGGEQYRRVMCLKGGKSATDCDSNFILDSTQSCNPGPCNEDEVIPVDSSLTPVTDGEEECEEDYPEEGLDEDLGDHIDLMFSDSPSSTVEGSGSVEYNFNDLVSALTTDIGSGSDSTDEYIGVSVSGNTDYYEGSGETGTTDVTESPESTTETDYTDSIEPGITKKNASETKLTKATEITIDGSTETEETSETEPIITVETDSTITTVQDETGSTESTVSGLTDDTTDTAETSTIVSTITEATSKISTIQSTVTEETDSTETSISSDSTDSTIAKETEVTEAAITDVKSSSGSTESTITKETKETLLTDSTESIVTEESSSPGSTETTMTEETKETSAASTQESTLTEHTLSGSTESTRTEETSLTDSSESIRTEETKDTSPIESTESTIPEKLSTFESMDSVITEETTSSGTTESTITEETTSSESRESTIVEENIETSPTSLTESTITEETSSSVSTEPTLTVETSSSISTEPTLTEETSPSVSTESTLTEETSSSVSTESTLTEETSPSVSTESTLTEETSPSVSTESTLTEETSPSVSTESTLTEETSPSVSTESTLTKETLPSVSTESTLTEETSSSVSTESTLTEETSPSVSTESTLTEETSPSVSTESTLTEETSPSVSTESTLTEETSPSVSTESTVTKETLPSVSTESTLTEETSPSVSTESTVTEKTSQSVSTESTLLEETSTSASTETTATKASEGVSPSASTETTVTKASEETSSASSTESTLPEETSTVTTIINKTVSVVSTELEETTTQKSTVPEEPTETEFISTTEIASTVSSTDEKTTRTKSPEVTISEEGSTTTESLEATASTESSSTESESLTTILTLSESTTESIVPDIITTESAKTTEVSVIESEETEGSTTETIPPTATESSSTTESETISTVTLTMEASSEGSTENIVTESSLPVSTEPAEPTTPGSTEEPKSTSAGTSESSLSTTEEPLTKGTTIWDYRTTLGAGSKPKCKPRKTTCAKSKFGCCPDRKTFAAGPFDEGCEKPRTCKESRYGCCPDGVSPAQGFDNEGCPMEPCVDALFGCCLSDNKTAAEGNDQEGCPPPPPACKATKFGCCEDEETNATGPDREGCPEKTTTEVITDSSTTESELTQSSSEPPTSETTDVTIVNVESCLHTEFGCCSDNETIAEGPNGQGCPCNTTVFGCCPDGVNTALGVNFAGCPSACKSSRYGCCSDNETPAHGPDHEGCCLLTAYGCCPDNRKPADGPHLEGCGCHYAQFGCCPDNVTYAHGPNNKGCGCQYTEHGCCPDRHTEATGPSFEGCPCNTYQFGCCPDGVTVAKGPGKQGCHCEETPFGCCGDGQTAATGPEQQGCDCSSSKFGCCPDGVTSATGDKFLGCTDAPENKQASCSLPTDRGSCNNYSVYWFYDVEYGGCSRFWYGGCEGNGNRFSTKEECEDVCVQPPPKDTCKLPKSKGACLGYHVMWHYDSESEQCRQFVYGGCLGNANKFETRQQCQAQCEPTRTADQCTLPIEPGSCNGNFPRWAFNSETHKCEEFIWGGCEGNPNRFGSEAACIQRCDAPGVPKPQCEQPQDIGNCTETQALWSFSQTENRCVPFYYSGCGGNENRFDSEELCAEVCPSAYVPDICTMPAETGECANYREKWYFDTTQQRCRQFYYGGCGGNSNNFPTREECEGKCTEQVTTTTSTTVQVPEPQNLSEYCFMEMDVGPCTQMETRWAYDYTVGRCTTFQYGGCGGNGNNFPTVEHCQYYCTPTQDLCQLPMLSGPCEQSLMRWFYDPSSDSCSQFTYGGCDGNDNRFDTREICERRCRTGPVPTAAPEPTTTVAAFGANSLPPECSIAPILERCVRAGEVWYMDTQRRECVPFENNESGVECMNTGVFASQESCERSCGVFQSIDVCRYDVDPGPCQSYKSKYYFNATAGRCIEFAYGGCHGGPNRFSTIDECMDVCRPEIDPCKLGPEPGNCLARFIQWYYIPERDECNQFIYTGCGGNDNRFESREDCEGRCRRGPLVATTTTTTTSRPIPTHSPVSEECRTPPSLEPCGDAIAAYYYNFETSSCEVGPIGGCGYQNTYRSEEECERRCGAFKDVDVCRTYLDPGSCRMSIAKFYWDSASGSCQPYTYSGCGGSPNRFSTAEECKELCGPTGPAPRCLEEGGSVGTPGCGPPSRRWYYSVSRADCIVFAYQSCGGNNNNFISYEECASLCKVLQPTDMNEVLPDCSVYTEHCSRAASECPFGVETRVEDGCQRCTCKPVSCESFEQECNALLCAFGVLKVAGEDGCPRCTCYEDPCQTANCSSTESCRAEPYRDPTTQEARYIARCEPEVNNEILPECDRYNEECASLNCQYGVQRTRTASGCERCSCVPVEVDCTSFREECDRIQCSYGIDWTKDDNGCPRCTCTDPCKTKVCSIGERCVVIAYRDPISTRIKNSTECRMVNKPGFCPDDEPSLAEDSCQKECSDDADCRGMAKCCQRGGCPSICLPPVTKTTTISTTTTTIPPELPHPPAANTELTKPEVTAAEGGKATLRCLFHGNPPPKITWRRNEITIDGDVGRYRLLSDGALEIVSLYRNDSGVYICIADNGLGTAMQEIRLQVSDPVKAPAGIAGDENAVVTGDLGRPLILRCLTYGYPKPTVYWYRGPTGPMVPFSSAQYEARFDVLKIRKLTHDTLGEYLCTAYNGHGKPASWLVVVRAYQPEEAKEDNKYLVTRGDKIVDLTSREPRTETSTTTTTPAALLEPEPEPDSDYDTPIIYTVPVSTNISNTAMNLTIGRELTVTCDVNGYPEPDVYWTKDSVRLVHNERIWISGTSISRLTIPHVATSDSGLYACHAVNAYGSHSSTMQVIVQAPSIPAKCVDNPYFANCTLIVRNRFCNHMYYSRFCCKSCMEAGQLTPEQAEMQSDQPYARRK